MPTIFRQYGFRVMIYTSDHIPAHVHIYYGDALLIVNLGESVEAIEIRDNFGMKRNDARRAIEICEENHATFLQEWREIHP